ncbi:Branched-chain amino acid transport protein (AzlD) [Marinobacter segnicrescens]|uniref:Branched-chain amino acid transport protein (AzlD) n=1 Tax=Marinobacter segnicrescens TaxID=430453 RepID=A0A1H9YUA5_9GAMM|nr:MULTISPECIES: AzlD domain-containing protein [Marinobacter]UZD64417.1 AzlD domain-containing protein [Marinobacter sp. AN1]SES72716.1 Branched-chain amino acid transport protein (AzlD) [Marinobacter segnicrescens]
MSENHLIWLVILAGAAASYGFRSLPLLVMSRLDLVDSGSDLLRFFDYATYAIIGGIIGSALVSGGELTSAVSDPRLVVGLMTVAATFALCLKLRGNLLPLFAGVGLYQVLSWLAL